MEIAGWRSLFAPHILSRGKQYFYEDRVEDLHVRGNTVTASVSGSEEYEVEIELEGGRVAEMFCSCPYAEGGEACKHMAAVLYELTEGQAPVSASQEESAVLISGADLEQAVRSLSTEEAKDLLLILGKSIDKAAGLIMLRATGKVTEAQKTGWENRLSRITERYAGPSGFVPFEQVSDYICDLEEVIYENVPLLLACGLVMDAFDLTGMALSEAMGTELDDDGELDGLCSCCAGVWTVLLAAADERQTQAMARWLLDQCADLDNEIIQGWIENFLFQNFHDKQTLRELLPIVDAKMRKAEQAGRILYLGQLVMRRLELMERCGFSQEAIGQFENSYRALPIIRRREIQRVLEREQYEEAILLLKESKELDAHLPGFAGEYSETLMKLYRKLGREAEYREELLYSLRNFRQRDLQGVDMLRKITAPEDWPALRDELLTWKTMEDVVLPLLEREELYDRLLEAVTQQDNLWVLDRYEPLLRDRYPDKLRDHMVSHLQNAVQRPSGRQQYAALIRRLRSLNKYPRGEEEAKKLAREWRLKYPRRRSLLEELTKAGF